MSRASGNSDSSKCISPQSPPPQGHFTDSSDEDRSQNRDPRFRVFDPTKRPRCRDVPSNQRTRYDSEKEITLLCVTDREGKVVVDPKTLVISLNIFRRKVGEYQWICGAAAYAGPDSKYNKAVTIQPSKTRFSGHACALKQAMKAAGRIVEVEKQIRRVKFVTESRTLVWILTHMHAFKWTPESLAGWKSLVHTDLSMTLLLYRRISVKCQLWCLSDNLTDQAQAIAWDHLEKHREGKETDVDEVES